MNQAFLIGLPPAFRDGHSFMMVAVRAILLHFRSSERVVRGELVLHTNSADRPSAAPAIQRFHNHTKPFNQTSSKLASSAVRGSRRVYLPVLVYVSWLAMPKNFCPNRNI